MPTNPYDFAIHRYASEEMQRRMKRNPIGVLANIMGLGKLKARIRQAGQPAFIAMCGVVMYRQLGRHERRDVLRRVLNLGHAGYPELSSRLYRMVVDNQVQAAWNPWSMSVNELDAFIATNESISNTIEFLGISWDLENLAALAAVLYAASQRNLKESVKSNLVNSKLAQAARKHGVTPDVAKGLVGGYMIVSAIATVMEHGANYDLARGEEERDRRVPPPLKAPQSR